MLAGWSRAFALLVVAAIFVNAHCSNACAFATTASAETPSNDCPQHHKPSHEHSSSCQHQHSEFVGPESGIAKVNVAPVVPVLAVLTPGSSLILSEQLLLSKSDSGSPPGDQIPTTISILRI